MRLPSGDRADLRALVCGLPVELRNLEEMMQERGMAVDHSNDLPLDHQADAIVMRQMLLEATRCVERGHHKIASGQDWRTTLKGELVAKF